MKVLLETKCDLGGKHYFIFVGHGRSARTEQPNRRTSAAALDSNEGALVLGSERELRPSDFFDGLLGFGNLAGIGENVRASKLDVIIYACHSYTWKTWCKNYEGKCRNQLVP
jgi:hypothetical protein